MRLELTLDEAAVLRVVGAETFIRGRDYAERGAVSSVCHEDHGRVLFGQVAGKRPRPYVARVALRRGDRGDLTGFAGTCTCPVVTNCKHSVAVALVAFAASPAASAGDPPAPAVPAASSWTDALDTLLGQVAEASAASPGVGLQFEAIGPADAPVSVVLRPVLEGKTGWVRSGISWTNLRQPMFSPGAARRHHPLLAELVALYTAQTPAYAYYGSRDLRMTVEDFASPRAWDVLTELQARGVPFVQPGRPAQPVIVHPPAEAVLDLRAAEVGVTIQPRLMLRGAPLPGAPVLLGSPTHGLAWRDAGSSTLHLAPLARAAGLDPATVLTQPTLAIPEAERTSFLDGYLPRLRDAAPVVSSDGSVELPGPIRPRLLLTVEHLPGHQLRLGWRWRYGERDVALYPDRRGEQLGRDLEAEREILGPVAAATADRAELHGDGRLSPQARLSGMAAVQVLRDWLPAIERLDQVDVEVLGERVDYRESTAAPVISFDEAGSADRDWFDLAVTITVGGDAVPFGELFTALAREESHLILPDGTYFSLDRPEFVALAALIEESRALYDAPPGTVRAGRLSAGLWDELDRLGVITAQADTWRETAASLADLTRIETPPTPSGLQARLRGYQIDGFAWLALLYQYRLGGVLADEMGLGKTLQALALVCHAREKGLTDAPFLVIAPTSVVHNWVAECQRFAPALPVRAITETQRRRGAALSECADGAAIVVTSYTLFRLEYEQYADLEWAGLFLDEAQFVKNHQSQAYQCAKKLPAPVKIAITGTPLENNLTELWALLSITSPGLLGRPQRFTDYYRTPIERGHDGERLDQLRGRVRPLMLRRTKAQVIDDLPAKQEQILELDLNTRHRGAYQKHLQRERQKVLGLLGDLDRNRIAVFRSLTLLRQASLDIGLVDPARAKIPSTKLDALLDQLTEVVADGHRAVVFSQFTRFLDLARKRLDAAGIDYAYLDGRTKRRAAVISAFRDGDAPVFLISLKAGGFGLNLTEADYCFLLDPWWNPATEAQAVDRVHRIGQTRTVMVYRLVARDTIEEKVMALKAEKSALFDSVLDGGAAHTGRLSAADIRGLLE